MKIWTIYCHTHVESCRRYIGLTSQTMKKRWSQHTSKAKTGSLNHFFPNAIKKYGKDSFIHEELACARTIEDANAIEEAIIEQYDTRNPEKGFNLAKGGGVQPHPMKNPWARSGYREKISASMKLFYSDLSNRLHASKVSRTALSNPEIHHKMSAIATSVWQRPGFREKMKSIRSAPELAKRMNAGLQAYNLRLQNRTHCKHGHPFTPENICLNNGHKICRICKNSKERERSKRKGGVPCDNGAQTEQTSRSLRHAHRQLVADNEVRSKRAGRLKVRERRKPRADPGV